MLLGKKDGRGERESGVRSWADGDEGTKEFETYRAYCDQLGMPGKVGAEAACPVEQDTTIQALKRMGCEVTDDSVAIEGQLDTYIVNRRSREIRRLRDGTLLKIDTGGEKTMESEALARMFQLSAGSDKAREWLPLAQALRKDNLFGWFLRETGPR